MIFRLQPIFDQPSLYSWGHTLLILSDHPGNDQDLLCSCIRNQKIYISYKNKAAASDFGTYWTSSSKRLLALMLIIFAAALIMLHAIAYPSINEVRTVDSNYTVIEQNIERDKKDIVISTINSNLDQLRLAIIIGIIVVILWPSIRTIKVGSGSFEIEKLTQIEEKQQIYMSWIPEEILRKGTR